MEILRLFAKASLLIMDEPAVLTPQEAQNLMEFIEILPKAVP